MYKQELVSLAESLVKRISQIPSGSGINANMLSRLCLAIYLWRFPSLPPFMAMALAYFEKEHDFFKEVAAYIIDKQGRYHQNRF